MVDISRYLRAIRTCNVDSWWRVAVSHTSRDYIAFMPAATVAAAAQPSAACLGHRDMPVVAVLLARDI